MSAHDNCESETEITACSFNAEPAGGRSESREKSSDTAAAFGQRGSGSPKESMMSDVEDEARLEDITCVEMENDSPDEDEIVASTQVFGADPLRTLGEILAYCQVMYGAIQKLDEKFEVLQARVTNIQVDQSSQKVYSPNSIYSFHSEVNGEDSSFPNLLQHSSSSPPPADDTNSPSLLLIPENPTSPSLSANSPPRTVKKMFLKKRWKKPERSHTNTNSPASKTPAENAARSEKFVLPSCFLRKASTMPRPTSAARFLLRNVFSHEELLHSNTKGDPARGLSKLDPAKISAIREWLQKKYPKYDLNEKGKDWRACVAVMNKGARYVRLMDKKRKPGPITDNQPKPDSPLTPMTTAEIDVELSDSDNDNLHKQKVSKGKFRIEADRMSENEDLLDPDAQVYLGCPDRQVKVPQFALYMAWQRPSAALAARYLIKFIFSDEILVKSNVYGNAEYGMEPLDHNRISALREHLCDRYPELKLDEDGHDWKSCVDAINSSIRKTRHKHKKLRR